MSPRVHSHNGCLTCKMRKKKCGEEKPKCSSCTRLNLKCMYKETGKTGKTGAVPGGIVSLGRRQIGVPLYLVRQLPICNFESADEEASFVRLPLVFTKFYNPLCERINGDTAALMQLAISDRCVRKSALACSSTAFSSRGSQSYEIDRVAFGKAIHEVNQRVAGQNPTKKDIFGLLLAVFFLGIIESLGSSVAGNEDMSIHFKPGVTLVGIYQNLFAGDWSGLPRGLCLLVLEGFMYFSTQSHFTPDLCALEPLWRNSCVFETLMSLNPPSTQSACQSPALCGQYEIFQMVFDLMFMFRAPALSSSDSQKLQSLKSTVVRVQARLADELAPLTTSQDFGGRYIELTYRMYCRSISICIECLQSCVETRSAEHLDMLVNAALQFFLSNNVVPANYSFMVWPLHVLSCTISRDSEFESFLQQLRKCEKYMNPGHHRRLQLLMEEVKEKRRRDRTDGQLGPEKNSTRLSAQLPRHMSALTRHSGKETTVTAE